jgi:hypothetical protein
VVRPPVKESVREVEKPALREAASEESARVELSKKTIVTVTRRRGVPRWKQFFGKVSLKSFRRAPAEEEVLLPLKDPLKVEGAKEEDDPNLPKWKRLYRKYWEIVGGGSLSLSIGIHLVVMIAAYFIVTAAPREPKVDFLPGGGSKGAAEASAQVANQINQKRNRVLNRATPMQRVVSTSLSATIALPDMPMVLPDLPKMSSTMSGGVSGGFGSIGAGGGAGKGVGIGNNSGFVNLPPMMQSRCSNTERLQKLKEGGGSPQCEVAVSKSLNWLKGRQNKDGSWGNSYKGGMTGLVLLCYLGRCETPDSQYYGENIMKGLLYLMELGDKNRHGIFSTNPGRRESTYEHGIATYALGEMYTLARMGSRSVPGMRESFEKGVQSIIKFQREDGAWAYNEGGSAAYSTNMASVPADLSVTGWQYQALKAGHLSGLKINGLPKAIENTVRYLESTQTSEGGFGNESRGADYNQYNLSGAAILGLQTLGQNKNVAISKGIKFSGEHFFKEPPAWNKNANLYSWYYYTQAFFQQGGTVWKMWNETAVKEILANQAKDGTWSDETITSLAGSTIAAAGDRPLYRVALCTLMLEVFYRYLKAGDKPGSTLFDNK